MSDKKCAVCEYWDAQTVSLHGKFYGNCESGIAISNMFGILRTTCNFGCDFWKKRKPTSKERLTERIENLVMRARMNSAVGEEIDEIIAMFEEYQKKPKGEK